LTDIGDVMSKPATSMSRRVAVQYPVPLELAANLTKAIGIMYPDATIRTDDPRSGTCMVFDLGGRKGRSSKKALLEDMADETDADLLGFGDGVMKVGTPQEATANLAYWAQIMLSVSPEALNYVEQTVTDPESGRVYCVTACWSKEQTPHELRMAAEERATRAEARVVELEAALAAARRKDR
jgi:hypothetical protein